MADKLIKALSLWEPWASLMRSGSKTMETRSWATRYRGPLLICASARQDRGSLDLLTDPVFQAGLRIQFTDARRIRVLRHDLHFGKAVALVDLVDCVFAPDAFSLYPRRRNEQAYGDYSPGRWAWVTDNLRIFEPFTLKGKQGLFDAPIPDLARSCPQELDQ